MRSRRLHILITKFAYNLFNLWYVCRTLEANEFYYELSINIEKSELALGRGGVTSRYSNCKYFLVWLSNSFFLFLFLTFISHAKDSFFFSHWGISKFP